MARPVGFKALERYGRLANQLFQVAAVIGVAHTHGLPVALNPSWSYRPFFSVPDSHFSPKYRSATEFYEFPEVEHIDHRARPYGQDPALFRDVADDVRRFFYPSPEAQSYLGWHSRWDGGIAVHVRRGDLLTQTPGFQPALTVDAPDYYRTALDVLDPMDVLPVVVFSDDPQWCAENQQEVFGRKVEVRQTKPRSHIPREYRIQPAMDWIDLLLMGQFDNLIISNSTYGWWAAWLNTSAKNVLYPDLWYGPNLAHVNTELLFVDLPWRRVPCA